MVNFLLELFATALDASLFIPGKRPKTKQEKLWFYFVLFVVIAILVAILLFS